MMTLQWQDLGKDEGARTQTARFLTHFARTVPEFKANPVFAVESSGKIVELTYRTPRSTFRVLPGHNRRMAIAPCALIGESEVRFDWTPETDTRGKPLYGIVRNGSSSTLYAAPGYASNGAWLVCVPDDLTFTSTKTVTVDSDRVPATTHAIVLADSAAAADATLYPIEDMLCNGGEDDGKRYVRVGNIIVADHTRWGRPNAKVFSVLDKFLGKPAWLAGDNRIVAVASGKPVGVIMGINTRDSDLQVVRTIRTQQTKGA